MEKIKAIGIFLAVLLGLFILVGMYYGALFFWFVLKLMIGAAIIGWLLVVWFKSRKKE